MGDLSEHFSRSEFACRDHCGIQVPKAELIDALEEFRAIVGRPVTILSGVRCAVHNREVGGSRDSRHLHGDAADLLVRAANDTQDHMTVFEMYRAALRVEPFSFGGIGLYPDRGFIHVDTRPEKARWGQITEPNGHFIYVSFEIVLEYMSRNHSLSI